ncbi:MAG TPA: acyl-CoA desaturase [Jatrophihabitans sp.]
MTAAVDEYVQPETDQQAAVGAGPKPVFEGGKKPGEQIALYLFMIVPALAVLAAIPMVWGWGISWLDVVLFFVFYIPTGLGITVGYHRFFTHGSFKASRPLELALLMMGEFAIEGPMLRWVADHRRHHAFSDREGDPHSPWRYSDRLSEDATGWQRFTALAKGFAWAHVGWMFDEMHSNRDKYVPDLLADTTIRRVDKLFVLWVVLSVSTPALLGGLISWSWQGAVTAFVWAGLIRVFVLHHVTWSVNSVCHIWGRKQFTARDRSTNVWWLAIPSFGESFHNLHHADPTAARHGVLRGQVDESARLIWFFEKMGWATDVRWPKPERLARLRAAAATEPAVRSASSAK